MTVGNYHPYCFHSPLEPVSTRLFVPSPPDSHCPQHYEGRAVLPSNGIVACFCGVKRFYGNIEDNALFPAFL